MALPFLSSFSYGCLTEMPPLHTKSSSSKKSFINAPKFPIVQCSTSLNVSGLSHTISERRSPHYQPSGWDYDYIQSLSSKYLEESYADQSRMLREEVGMRLCKVVNPLDQLELIDTLQRLGVAYHFNSEIRKILENVYTKNVDRFESSKTLSATALEFRLLRQHGYNLSTEVFNSFLDETGNFKKFLSLDAKGMLSLYEASFHSMEDETILVKARDFTLKYLQELVNESQLLGNEASVLEISHALELPLRWRMPRWEALWFVNEYERRPNMDPTLLQFAKLDFNMVQAIHQEELKWTSRRWQRTGLEEKFSFFRNRLVGDFFWALGMKFEPRLGYFRRIMTKVVSLITVLDDTYDAYGTLEELELFTEVIERWDISAKDSLPHYMQIIFQVFDDFANEIDFDIQKEKGHNILSYIRRAWAGLCKSYLTEAKWYHSGYTPSLEEYIDNAWVSISAPCVLVHAYFLIPDPIRKEDLDCLEENPNLFRLSGLIFRLVDDLGTTEREMETGDVPSSIRLYMNESGASEADAREYVKSMVYTTWQKMNEEVAECRFSHTFASIAVELARTSLCYYLHGDGYANIQDPEIKSIISSFLFETIPN